MKYPVRRFLTPEFLLRVSPVIINVLFCFVVSAVLYSRIETYTVLIDWDLDFRILLLINTFCILLEPFISLKKYVWVLFASRCVVLVIMAVPYPQSLFLDTFLLTGLFMSVISRLDPRYTGAGIFSFITLYLTLKIIPAVTHFKLHLPLADIVFFAGFFTSLGLLHYLSRISVSRYSRSEKNIIVLKNSIKELSRESSHFLNYAARAEEKSSTAERKKITRDLHDIIGKTFTDIIMMMEANVRNVPDDKEELKEIFQWVGEQSRIGLGEIRQVLYDLRSSIREEPVSLKSLPGLLESFRTSAGIDVILNWANARISYGPSVDSAVYRIIQEALVNALRHGNASEVHINFWEGNSLLTVAIQDNGSPAGNTGSKGLGQSGMEERLHDLEGTILFSRNREGYLVQVKIPLNFRVDRSESYE